MKTAELIRQLTSKGLSQEEALETIEGIRSPGAKAAIIMYASSVSPIIIEKHLKVSEKQLKNFLLLEPLQEIYDNIMADLALVMEDKYFESLIPKAIQVKVDILNNPDMAPMLRDKVASDIIDRVKGKPKQSIETKNMNLNVSGSINEIDSQINAVASRIHQLEGDMKERAELVESDLEAELVE